MSDDPTSTTVHDDAPTSMTATTLTYTVPTDGTTAQPDITDKSSLIAYPADATTSTDVCSYAVTFQPSETDDSMLRLVTTDPAPSPRVSGTAHAITATYEAHVNAQVSAARTNSCALAADGSVVCWGADNQGRSSPPALASPPASSSSG